jgi:hypothetical protein
MNHQTQQGEWRKDFDAIGFGFTYTRRTTDEKGRPVTVSDRDGITIKSFIDTLLKAERERVAAAIDGYFYARVTTLKNEIRAQENDEGLSDPHTQTRLYEALRNRDEFKSLGLI